MGILPVRPGYAHRPLVCGRKVLAGQRRNSNKTRQIGPWRPSTSLRT
jgi:hypothetical protein